MGNIKLAAWWLVKAALYLVGIVIALNAAEHVTRGEWAVIAVLAGGLWFVEQRHRRLERRLAEIEEVLRRVDQATQATAEDTLAIRYK